MSTAATEYRHDQAGNLCWQMVSPVHWTGPDRLPTLLVIDLNKVQKKLSAGWCNCFKSHTERFENCSDLSLTCFNLTISFCFLFYWLRLEILESKIVLINHIFFEKWAYKDIQSSTCTHKVSDHFKYNTYTLYILPKCLWVYVSENLILVDLRNIFWKKVF
jgi:hypothetical protein